MADDRDYLRSTDYAERRWSLSWILIIGCVATFTVQFLWQFVFFRTSANRGLLLEWFALHPEHVVNRFRAWQLLTHVFVQIDLFALVFDMLALYWFGKMLEELVGMKQFAGLILGAVLSGAIVFTALGFLVWPGSTFLGPSSAIMAVVVAAALTWPDRPIIFFVFPMKLKHLAILYVIFDIYQTVVHLGVPHLANLAGAAWGFGFWKLKDRVSQTLSRWDAIAEENRDRAEREASRDHALEIDAILKKISRDGIGSLTSRERAVLDAESKKKRGS